MTPWRFTKPIPTIAPVPYPPCYRADELDADIARLQAEAEARAKEAGNAPDADDPNAGWLTISAAALMTGFSVGSLSNRIEKGRLTYEWRKVGSRRMRMIRAEDVK